MLPELPKDLSPADLRELYHNERPEDAKRYGVTLHDAEEWSRYRKYAFHRCWSQRIALGGLLDETEANELLESLSWRFLGEVAQGVIGDAARCGLLAEERLADFLSRVGADSYAQRQIRARMTLLAAKSPTEQAIDALIELRTGWALSELVERCASRPELLLFEKYGTDARIIRSERHLLREAIRKRLKELRH